MRFACTRGSGAYDVCQKRLDMHIAGQRAHRELYYANHFLSEKQPEKCVTIIHDKMVLTGLTVHSVIPIGC